MKIVVITGTEYKGVTYRLKEIFLEAFRNGVGTEIGAGTENVVGTGNGADTGSRIGTDNRAGTYSGSANEIQEYVLPKDGPEYCTGCKVCFNVSEMKCPHAKKVIPIWEAMLGADLLVFCYPVYVMRAPGQMKALLDHFGCHWMVHRPDSRMFRKRAVIITQSIGAPNGAAQKDVMTSLNWLGVSKVEGCGFGLMEGVEWEKLTPKRRAKMEAKVRKLAAKYARVEPVSMSLRVRAFFAVSRAMHRRTLKRTLKRTLELAPELAATPSADDQHWLDQGWSTK